MSEQKTEFKLPQFEDGSIDRVGLQAENMARVAGIELRPDQIDRYKECRNDKSLEHFSDHAILYFILDEDQRILFEQKFNKIDDMVA
jgi:hypothetical protein